MQRMPDTSGQNLAGQLIIRDDQVQAEKSPRKAERHPRGWAGVREVALNGDEEALSVETTLMLRGRKRRHSCTSKGPKEDGVL